MTSPDRNAHWMMVAAFSTIALVSITSSFVDDEKLKDQEKETKWAVSAISVALVFSAIAVFANFLLKEKFVGTIMEGGLAILTCGFWASVLPAIMDGDNYLAMKPDVFGITTMENPNLYFFSWGAFIMSFFVLYGYLQRGAKLSGYQVVSWANLAMTSFVVMVSASRLFEDLNCDNTTSLTEDRCKRTKLAVSVGVISAIVSLVYAFLGRFMEKGGKFKKMLYVLVTWVVFVLWIFGIIYICFGGVKAAAPNLGNLYFFTWGSFALSVSMAMKSLKLLMGGEDTEEAEEEAPKDDDSPKEAPQQEDTPVIEPNEPDKVADEEVAA